MINKTTRKSALGKRGERFAADFYRSRGAEVIAANVNYAVGEIDLIVRENNVFVFVEVKTRTTANYGLAEAKSLACVKLQCSGSTAGRYLRCALTL